MIYGQLIFSQDCQDNSMGDRVPFSTKDAGTTRYSHAEESNLDPYLEE